MSKDKQSADVSVRRCRVVLHKPLPSLAGFVPDQRVIRSGYIGPGPGEYTLTDVRATDGSSVEWILPSTSVAFVIPER